MINGYKFDNYKAFISGEIKIKPITILIGANSSGKSSVTHLPLLLFQTMNSKQLRYYSSKKRRMFDLNGDVVRMGDSKSLIKDKDENNRLDLKFNVKIRDNQTISGIAKKIQNNFHESLWETLRIYYTLIRDEGVDNLKEMDNIQQALKLPALSNTENREILLKALQDLRKIVANLKMNPDKENALWSLRRRFSRSRGELVSRGDIKSDLDYHLSSQFIDSLKHLHLDEFAIGFSLKYSDVSKDFVISEIIIESDNKAILRFDFMGGLKKIFMPLLKDNSIDDYKSFFERMFHCDGNVSIFDLYKNAEFLSNDPVFPSLVNQFMYVVFEEFRCSFSDDSFNYIGPLREYPQKYFTKNSINNPNSGLSNYEIAGVLAGDESLEQRLNWWLTSLSTRLEADDSQEDVRRIKALRNNKTCDLDISDIGFGISQVFPVIVQSLLAQKGSTTIIEQPEVHLHPNYQAKLADLFIECIGSGEINRKRFIIETHSSTFLNRLRLRIAQGEVSRDDVVIYSFTVNSKNQGEIKQMKIFENGDFEWPEGYNEEEVNDIIEFAKNNVRNS